MNSQKEDLLAESLYNEILMWRKRFLRQNGVDPAGLIGMFFISLPAVCLLDVEKEPDVDCGFIFYTPEEALAIAKSIEGSDK